MNSSLQDSNNLTIHVDGMDVRIVVVLKGDWPAGKLDPTEYDDASQTIRVSSDYDYISDPTGWMRHEVQHHKLIVCNFRDDEYEYPYNAVEKQAYTEQFKYLRSKGVDNWLQLMPNKAQYVKILMKYWNDAGN